LKSKTLILKYKQSHFDPMASTYVDRVNVCKQSLTAQNLTLKNIILYFWKILTNTIILK